VSTRDHDAGPDTVTYRRYLEETDPLREQTNLDIVAALELPIGSRGLDIGCGIGTQALMLARAVGPRGHVTGLDIRPEFLQVARDSAARMGLSDRVSLTEGDCGDLPFEDGAFDWVWSSDFLGYTLLPREVTRVIKPGGSLIIVFWSSEQLLPGYPRLELRLKATSAGLAPFHTGSRPESHPLRGLARHRELGLTDTRAMTFVTSVHAPMSPAMFQAMADILEMRWSNVESELSKEDFELYRRLTDPGSPEYILNLPDYYGFFTYSVFTSRVPRDADRA